MTLVRFAAVGRQYGVRWVLRDVSFHVSQGERWGIVGRNGEGKTTLLRLLTGDDAPTEGEIWRHPKVRFTLLHQNRGEQSTMTVGEAALEPFAELLEMERRLEEEAEDLKRTDPESTAGERLLRSYDHHLEQFRRRGGYEMRARAEATLEGLGFAPERWSQPIRSLSGGELGRLRLAQTLLAAPDVLLLDEPTNHLDLRSTEWLEEYLRSYAGTVMCVSHDRVFLERLADHILHVEEGTAFPYTGGYQSFLVQREERRALQRKEFEKQQAHIARTEEFIRRNLAGQKTKQAKSRRTQLERMERSAAPAQEERAMALRFGNGPRSGGTVLRIDDVSCGYGGEPLFAPFSAEIGREERIAIVGPNGCGKSTLMRVLAGTTEPQSGEVVKGAGVKVAYYRQDFTHLNPDHSIIDEVADASAGIPLPELRAHLARFLFSGDDVEARVGDLSGGEQARVALARVTLKRANLLLLDEPTNHLDIPSREALEQALRGFDGTVILISHDRAFLSTLTTRVWGFEAGSPSRIADYPGGFDEWIEDRARRASSPPAGPPSRSGKVSDREHSTASASGLSKNEQRRRQREMERLEERISTLEAEITELEARLADPSLYAPHADPAEVQSISRRRDEMAAELEESLAAWEQVGEQLALA